jgi:hypothetical protein
MASHKVPSDVETADKLIGFLSLKQFLFVLAGFGMLFLAYTFARVNIFLGIPFLPFIVVAFVLGLYQRHDQPVEVFLGAWLKFKFAPKTRIWNQEGYEQHVIVTVPKKEVIDYTKGMTAQDVRNQLHGLGSTLDTKGWSTKGVADANSLELGTGESERLIDLSEIENAKKKLQPKYDPGSDIFDANNSPTASMVEVDVDKAAQASSIQAAQILSTKPVAETLQTSINPALKPEQTMQIDHLANSEAPISTIAQQAAGTVDLEKGTEFTLR